MSSTDLLAKADRLRAQRTPFVLATVVRAERPTSAKAGDRAIVMPDGTMEGFVGGVCAESTVRLESLRLFDGGESTLLVASQIPYPQVAFYRDYLTGAGYVATGVQFKDVGTSLKVGAAILPGNQVRVRLTPTISWLSADRSGVIEVNEASTELIVPSGRPVVLGGTTTQTHELTRRILGYRASETATETTMALTATIR